MGTFANKKYKANFLRTKIERKKKFVRKALRWRPFWGMEGNETVANIDF